MKSDFTVLIVGRENVGKSSIFNKLINQQKAIVDDYPGVTRDRLYGDAEWFGKKFTLVDTGGILFDGEDLIKTKVVDTIKDVIKSADLVLMVADGKSGLIPDDKKILTFIKENNPNYVVAVNKIDSQAAVDKTYEFYNMGIDKIFPVSSAHSLGLDDLLDYIAEKIPKVKPDEDDGKLPKIAITGRENAGKSSLFNALLKEERSIVTEIPGTTRDAVDSMIELNGKKFIIIDTAGVKKRRNMKGKPEAFGIGRSFSNVKRSDVVLHVIDITTGITEVDKKVLGYAAEHLKAVVICVNKWDLVKPSDRDAKRKEYIEYLRDEMKFMDYAPVVFVSAKNSAGLEKLIDIVIRVEKKYNFRVKTSILNRMIREAVFRKAPVTKKGSLKIYYATQVSAAPPTFTLFVNSADKIHESYLRYVVNKIREDFGFDGCPIKLKVKQKEKKEA
ncbi:MAG: ribosome biogenesis GTPase Der [Candidatus Goldiibacteriota bacterium HGW-Goldbacteria-1]|jgi:GTP-binding protein|nr:MAG: ribosome biogenesis GTPase Der [Candidatus Goldiibacteriota bacterium HGW-Goldbacteria-1]